jgi:hypothetical protein
MLRHGEASRHGGHFEEAVLQAKASYRSIRGRGQLSRITNDKLLDLASRIDSDGGLPGKNIEARASATAIALLAFLSQGHTVVRGAFRSHVARLVSFLKALTGLSSLQQQIIADLIALARKGTAPTGDWITLAYGSGNHWKEIESAVLNAQGVSRDSSYP